ncbi:PH domain-containing protein [Streptomyces cellostaticus]|uniref:PH domain-containing protein n=1 Tax=Streptomyces cellostaticus TaxID=67285 RepID=UPI001ABEF65F
MTKAGRGRAGAARRTVLGVCVCVLLLACAGAAAWFVPDIASDERAWRAATPCAAVTPDSGREDCLTTVPAVIARTDPNPPKQDSWLYFTGSRPLARLAVSSEAAVDFEAGDHVRLTVWRGQVMKVTGEGHVWHEHVTTPGSLAVLAAVLALAGAYPGAQVALRLRYGRRLHGDEVPPSALPFAGVLVGTALWLLPLCYLHPTTLLSSPVPLTWAAAGSLLTLALFRQAWRATSIRTPGEPGAPEQPDEGEVFLPARFLEPTDYNPHGFGTHILVGDGTLAVAPGPGHFAAKRIPVERLTVRNVRRARGSDGDTVPRSWHIAELDDAGTPIRLSAAPADLTRILRELQSGGIA